MTKRTQRKCQTSDKDNALNTFLAMPEIFADLFNAVVFEGKQVILPENLEPADRLLSEVVGKGRNQAKLTRYRDVFKAYRDENAAYILLGIESQTAIHYAMPLRNMIYDALSMLARLRQKSAKHLALKDLKRPDEFLSRFSKTDRIDPVISLVVYTGTATWDGPRSLHDMISFPNEAYKRFTPNYFINFVFPAKMDEAMFVRFSTELHDVFKCIRFSDSKEAFNAFIMNDLRCQEMSFEAVQAINACTHANIKVTRKGGRINMCQAIIDLKKEAYDDGFQKGEESGFQKGSFCIALRMYNGKYSIQEISEMTGLTQEEIKTVIQAQQYMGV